jgi:hypothetical protein
VHTSTFQEKKNFSPQPYKYKKMPAEPCWIPLVSSHLFNHHASSVPALCVAVTVYLQCSVNVLQYRTVELLNSMLLFNSCLLKTLKAHFITKWCMCRTPYYNVCHPLANSLLKRKTWYRTLDLRSVQRNYVQNFSELVLYTVWTLYSSLC